MTTLSDRLKSLGVKVGARDLPPPAPRRHAVEQVIEGEFLETAFGPAFVSENVYESEYRHGEAALTTTASLRTIAEWANEPGLAEGQIERWAFLDIETTGLAGGTGTYAFLVGAGRFEGRCFRLRQILMRDPAEEAAALAALAGFLQPLDGLVTFNGKAFDGPILTTRYRMNRLPVPFEKAGHLDLLPLARRLWRERLESRALGFLETHILGARRTEEDVPGWLIPQIYIDYVQSGDARPLKRIFYHNAMDVIAMAALLAHVAELLDQPLVFGIEHGLDLIAIARLFEDLGRWEQAAELYARGLEYDVTESVWRETQRRLSFLQRRRGDLKSALELWRDASGRRQVYAYVELAKYYEHRARDYSEAEQQTRAALALVNAPGFPKGERLRWLRDLEHRLERLEGKRKG